MKFNYTKFSRELRFSIGIEEESKKYFLSFPVFNSLAEYEEYYELTKEEYDNFFADLNNALDLLKKCREQTEDHRLMQQPGRLRGSWC